MKMPREVHLVTAGLALIFCGVYCSFLNNRLNIVGDVVDYFQLADSIRAGDGFTINGTFSGRWPPVTPLLLACAESLGNPQLGLLKAYWALTALLGVWLAYKLLAENFESRLAVLATLVTAVSFPFVYWSVQTGTEPPYIFFTMLALLAGVRATDPQRPLVWAVLAGVAAGMALLTRTIGVTLLGALGAAAFAAFCRCNRTEGRRLALALVCGGALAGGWYAYSWAKSGQTSVGVYSNGAMETGMYRPGTRVAASDLLHRSLENTAGYAFIFSNPDASLRVKAKSRLTAGGAASVGIMVLAAWGFAWHLVRRRRLPEYFVAMYATVLLLVPWYDLRYVVPILPFIFYYMFFSIESANRWLLARWNRGDWGAYLTASCGAAMVLAGLTVDAVSPQAKRLRSTEYEGVAREMYDASMWLKEFQPQATVMCRFNMFWYWTRMKTVGVPMQSDPALVWKRIRDTGVTHAIVDQDEFSGLTGKYLVPALDMHRESVRDVASFGGTRIVEVLPE